VIIASVELAALVFIQNKTLLGMLQDNIDYTDRRDLLAAIQEGLLRQLVGNRIHS